MNKNIMVE